MIGYQRERLHHLHHMAERFVSGEADSLAAARDLEREAAELLRGDAELGPLVKRLARGLPARNAQGASGAEAAGLHPVVAELRDALASRLP